ncbi:hypothetical protein P9112_004410 [Eukaryota sp. TZLM1-RC]
MNFQQFPPFKLDIETFPDQLHELDQYSRSKLSELEQLDSPSYDDLVLPLCQLSDRISKSWGIVTHLMGVQNSDRLREIHNHCQPLIVRLSSAIEQSRPVYEKILHIKANEHLQDDQRRIVEMKIRDAELSGVHLEGEKKQRFNEIEEQLASLSSTFSDNVLDSIKEYARPVTEEEVKGIPDSTKQLMKQNGETKGFGMVVTLDHAVYVPFMKYVENRSLREEVYKAFIKVASQDKFSNFENMEKILLLRKERAQLLGFNTHAEVVLQSKAISNDPHDVFTFLDQLRTRSYQAAEKEYAELLKFAKEFSNNTVNELRQWDLSYYMQRYKEKYLDLDEEALRPYFELNNVLQGLWAIVERVFGAKVKELDPEVQKSLGIETWHADCKVFEVCDQQPLSYIILDPYSRPENKRGGAWMDDGCQRSKILGEERVPVVYAVCNSTPPVGETPSLMTFNEVETLFHEMGHVLQGVLTEVDNPLIAGINGVEWDTVEICSQFMENWLYDLPTLQKIAIHYKTREVLSEDVIRNLQKLRKFFAGTASIRQLLFGTTDMHLHHFYSPNVSRAMDSLGHGLDLANLADSTETARNVLEVYHFCAKSNTIIPPLAEDYFLCGFRHIFAGGYSAAYWSYKFAEVLCMDLWYAFEEVGLDNNEKVGELGRKFRKTFLASGGGRHPLDLFREFRGRSYDTKYLMLSTGLILEEEDAF